MDLLERIALLPARVMCRLLGVPDRDVPAFAAWLDELSPIFGVMTPEQVAAADRAITELLAYVHDLTLRRRSDPDADLITALLAAQDGGDRLTTDEIDGLVANLLVGATTRPPASSGAACWSCSPILGRRPGSTPSPTCSGARWRRPCGWSRGLPG